MTVVLTTAAKLEKTHHMWMFKAGTETIFIVTGCELVTAWNKAICLPFVCHG
jgi:hypothetical protein